MTVEFCEVARDEKEILRNLIEKYDYKFSQYDRRDVNALGLYGYNYLDNYWTEEGRHAFFIRVDGQLAGFIMVRGGLDALERADFSIAEFFVMYKYRRGGVGRRAARFAFDKFKGIWQVKLHPKNVVSARFWHSVIDEYTGGKYEFLGGDSGSIYDDGTPADIYIFSSK